MTGADFVKMQQLNTNEQDFLNKLKLLTNKEILQNLHLMTKEKFGCIYNQCGRENPRFQP